MQGFKNRGGKQETSCSSWVRKNSKQDAENASGSALDFSPYCRGTVILACQQFLYVPAISWLKPSKKSEDCEQLCTPYAFILLITNSPILNPCWLPKPRLLLSLLNRLSPLYSHYLRLIHREHYPDTLPFCLLILKRKIRVTFLEFWFQPRWPLQENVPLEESRDGFAVANVNYIRIWGGLFWHHKIGILCLNTDFI